MTGNKILINRAPVLTLWAAVIAERLGFKHDEALSLGKALAGLNAQSKGQRLGIFKPTPKELKKVREHERREESTARRMRAPTPIPACASFGAAAAALASKSATLML